MHHIVDYCVTFPKKARVCHPKLGPFQMLIGKMQSTHPSAGSCYNCKWNVSAGTRVFNMEELGFKGVFGCTNRNSAFEGASVR